MAWADASKAHSVSMLLRHVVCPTGFRRAVVTDAGGTRTHTYTYQPNHYNGQAHTDRLASVSGGIVGSKAFGYDALGNVRSINTNGQTLYLSTDYEDRVTRFDFGTGPGQSGTYGTDRYNALGLRTLYHSADGADHALAYDGSSPGAQLLASGGTLFTPGLMKQDTAGQHFYQTDALGSVRGQTGNDQNPQGEVYYDAWGQPFLRQGSMPGPLGWAASSSYQTDADTGLMLLGNRYYDPSIGRFLSQDPSKAGSNWYAYCGNNPLSYVDPTGLTADPFSMAGSATQAQVEAQTILNGGKPGESYNVSVGGKVQYSFTISGGVPSSSGWSMGLGIAGDFISGNGSLTRYYGSSSTQSQQMRQSLGYRQVLHQIAAGNKSGGVKSGSAFKNSILQPTNGTQFQLGAFKWSFTNPNNTSAGVDISNPLTTNFLFYHVSDALNDNVGYPLYMMGIVSSPNVVPGEITNGGAFSTINQTIHINFP